MPIVTPRLRLRPSRKGASAFAPRAAAVDRLSDLNAPFDNPGNLRCRYYVPKGLSGPAPLVVVLHGCTQDAAVYDHGSGWSKLADRHGFVLLFPEQQRSNNPLLCFNWFQDGDTQRGEGETASIRAMIDAIGRVHPIDPGKIFVTGLSAGGAMTSTMLATYPELFAAGAIIAGVAYGCANGVSEAFDCMGGRGGVAAAGGLGSKVRAASAHRGPWPRVQVWQGSADRTVVASNAGAIVRQWAELHGVSERPTRTEQVAGHPLRVWTGPDGTALIEHYEIAGMDHGIPLDPGSGDGQSGEAGAHMLDVGLSSTDRIATFFGIAAPAGARASRTASAPKPSAPKPSAPKPSAARAVAEAKPRVNRAIPTPPPAAAKRPKAAAAVGGVQKVIEDALRAAGLMR